MQKIYKVYNLRHPVSREIRYVGVTQTHYLNVRLSQHMYNALKKNASSNVAKWIRILWNKTQQKPIIELIEECTENNWADRERYWISCYNNLTNEKKGGAGLILNRKEDGIKRSSQAHFIPIVQLSMEGEIIKEWESASSAHEKLKVSRTGINNAIKNHGQSKTCGGFYWMYKKDYELKGFSVVPTTRIRRKVCQFDEEGNFVKEYDTIADAARALDVYESRIHHAVKYGRKVKGYSFKEPVKIL